MLTEKIKKGIKDPKKAALFLFSEGYNFFLDFKRRPDLPPSDLSELNEINRRAQKRNDINDHLATLFVESLPLRPKLIVELGTRHGDSTCAFSQVARLCDSTMVSVDIQDCLGASQVPGWTFVQSDDIIFAQQFRGWCKQRSLTPKIDLLFIDTSHLLEHTRQEIQQWFPFLSKRAKVFFHDTNLTGTYFRKDGSRGVAWHNQRGVIAALEEYFATLFTEQRDFIDFRKGWLIKHYAHCNGLTILERGILPERSPEWKGQQIK